MGEIIYVGAVARTKAIPPTREIYFALTGRKLVEETQIIVRTSGFIDESPLFLCCGPIKKSPPSLRQ